MLGNFKTKELIFIALSGALMFTIAFSLGAGLIAVTGTPMIGGIVVNLFVSFIFVSVLLIVRRWGTATLIALIHTALSTPTINFGPPGFYKIFLGLVLGLIADTLLFAGRYKKIIYYVAAFVSFVVLVPVMWWTLTMLGLPGAENVGKLLIPFMAVYGVEALIGTWLAILVYEKKLKNTRLVRRLRD